MGNGARKRQIDADAASQRRIADTQERVANESLENSREDRELQKQIFFENIAPIAEKLIGTFDPSAYDSLSFPDIQRPDFKGQIRRDYYDDIAGIEQAKNSAVAQAEDYYTSSGLGRTGIRTGGLGSIARGAGADQSLARRNMQARNEMEDRDAYADSRELSLLRHADSRSANSERLNAGIAGANIMAGQQGTFNAPQWFSMGQGGYGAASGGYGNAAGTTQRAASIPGIGSTIAGFSGGMLGAALGNPGGLSSIWRRGGSA